MRHNASIETDDAARGSRLKARARHRWRVAEAEGPRSRAAKIRSGLNSNCRLGRTGDRFQSHPDGVTAGWTLQTGGTVSD